jgi:hypothetical protein
MYKNGLLEKYTPDNSKKRAFIIDNWRAYNLTDTRREFIALLNILDAHGETIDSLHDVCTGDLFCGIFYNGEIENDRDVIEGLFLNNTFYTPEDFPEYINTIIDNCHYFNETPAETAETVREILNEGDGSTVVTRTTDGYVVSVFC